MMFMVQIDLLISALRTGLFEGGMVCCACDISEWN